VTRRIAATLALWAALALPARGEDPTARGFDPDASRLALSLDGGFATETAAAAPAGTWRVGAVLDYSEGLLALSMGGQRDDLLASRLSLHLLGARSFGKLELAAELPMALSQQADFGPLIDQGVTGPLVDPVSSQALGDLRLGAKAPLLSVERWPLGLAALLDVRVPTGSRQAFIGEGFAVVPSVIATKPLGRVRLDAQLGYAFRGAGQYAQLVVHDGLVYAAGATVDLPPLSRLQRWNAIAELTGGWPRGYDASGDRYRAPLAARAGVRLFLSRDLSVEAGGGAGLGDAGYGRERWRAFLGVRWGGQAVGPPDDDADHDGVPNATDQCPTEPGSPELDGCPDADDDGIPDPDDQCPKEPGPAEHDGCPVADDEPLVELETERIAINDAITFDTGKDTIKKESFRVLDQVARLLQDHPELAHVRVEGHTDNVGAAAYNKDLSARRAASVVRYLVSKGVAAGRLSAAGYGFERPVATNATALGRTRNRRVEFKILGDEAAGTPRSDAR
jgi:OmpA-OmpF porin, OOP family